MGAGNIVEENVRSTTTSLWNSVPTVADKSWLDFDLKNYNKAFVNLSIVVGVAVLAKTALKLTCKTAHAFTKNRNVPTVHELQDKYGHHAWAVIGDCRGNEQYARFLALNGFNLVLLGSELDVEIAKDQAETVNKNIEIDCMIVDWKKEEQSLLFFEELMQKIEHRDVAFLVMPKIHK